MASKNLKKQIRSNTAKSTTGSLGFLRKTQFNWKIAAVIAVIIIAALGYLYVRLSDAAGYDGWQRMRVVQIAQGEIGQAEWSNRVLQYSEGNQENWCADFVSWVYWQAGIPFQGSAAKGRSSWRIPLVWKPVSGVPNLRDYAKFLGGWREAESGYRPGPGDIVILAQAGNTSLSHTGIVEKIDNTEKGPVITTIEGNADNKVSRRSYPLSDSRIDGYAKVIDIPVSTGWQPKL